MVLCDDCIRQLSTELLIDDLAILYALEGKETMKDALNKEELIELVGKLNYYSSTKVLQRLEILGLIYGGKNGKKYLYYLTESGKKMLRLLLS